MNDLNAEVPSTVIDVDAPAPGAADYRPEPITPEVAEVEKPMSLEDAVKQAAAETKDNADKDPKAKEEPKPKAKAEEPKPEKLTPERGENGKFAAKPKAETEPAVAEEQAAGAEVEQGRDEPRPSEGRDITRAPAHFLPRAKEAWALTNDDVRSEVYRMKENYEKGLEEGREAMEYRKELREFDDLAKGAGTTVKAALANYVAIDNQLKNDPVGGIERILKSLGITPEQYAQHVLSAPQRPKADPAVSQLQQTVQQLSQQLQHQQQMSQAEQQRQAVQNVENTLFNEVREKHPRFDELRSDIAFFWNSDKLSSIADERQRLFAATDMAERINPVGNNAQHEPLNPAQNVQRPINPAGTKSVKGSLTYGAEVPRKSAKVSLDEALKLAARSVNG